MRTKLAVAGLAAAACMAFTVDFAAASRLSVSNQQFRIVWTTLKFFDGTGGGVSIECAATLEGSFHSRTFPKTIGSLIGYVTRTAVGGCLGGQPGFLPTSLPWPLTYEGFSGALPEITRLRLLVRRVAMFSTTVTIECLFKENGTRQLAGELLLEEGGTITRFTFDRTLTIPLFSGRQIEFCPAEGGLEGTGQVTLLGSATTRITLTLI
ncbi:MAG TPA: hypothetical protein VFF79_05905 [Conexibacter sp.]|nr:hypothetical protein [Conexibacter sp.]